MRAAVLYGAKDIRLEDYETPDPLPGMVLIRIKSAGICGCGCKQRYAAGIRQSTFIKRTG